MILKWCKKGGRSFYSNSTAFFYCNGSKAFVKVIVKQQAEVSLSWLTSFTALSHVPLPHHTALFHMSCAQASVTTTAMRHRRKTLKRPSRPSQSPSAASECGSMWATSCAYLFRVEKTSLFQIECAAQHTEWLVPESSLVSCVLSASKHVLYW